MCIRAIVQVKLEGEKEIYLVSSLPYIVLFVVAHCYLWPLGLLRVLDIEQGFVVATITRHVSRRL